MQRRVFASAVIGLAGLVGIVRIGTRVMEHRGASTEPTPVDMILAEGAAKGAAPVGVVSEPAVVDSGGGQTGSESASEPDAATREPVAEGVVRFASGAPETGGAREWDLPATRNGRVQYWIDFLRGKNRSHTEKWLEREGKYGGYIRAQLRKRGMPEDLLYLGMIESGLSPKAYSRAHAAGLWQFIAETGRRYGLEVSAYVDERRDPVKATDAALTYLSELYDRFGSWYLAAAAYNTGENRVARVLRKRAGGRAGKESLFWRIDDYLPRETRDYVPLMLAAGYIAKNPARYGFGGIQPQAPLAWDEVKVAGGVALSSVASAAGVDEAAVLDLNPDLIRRMTPPDRSWPVRVPVGAGVKLVAALDQLKSERRLAMVVHRVRRGETLSHIARRYGVSLALLRSANAEVNPRALQIGERIRVPAGGSRAGSWTTYRVRRGDTLWDIARAHGVSVAEIRSWNGIGNRIYPGQRLRLPA